MADITLRPYRRCYDIGAELALFWLGPNGERTPIEPWPELVSAPSQVAELRRVGYRLEHEINEEKKEEKRRGVVSPS